MKRLWIGIAILAVLLAGSLSISFAMEKIHRPIARDLESAAQKALDEDWETALTLFHKANARWEKYHRFTAAFADHTPMDEMDTLLEELEIYAKQQENPHFSATCAHLYFMATAIAESHSASWWNLL